jgi:hypothetical protein
MFAELHYDRQSRGNQQDTQEDWEAASYAHVC